MNWLTKRFRSFRYAFEGVATLLRTQPNARIHLVATVVIIASGVLVGVSRFEWIALVAAISLVWITEALNSSIEFLADEVSLENRPRIKQAKDLGAAAVLIATIAAVVIGGLIFLPYVERALD